jgi:hypothetical protein
MGSYISGRADKGKLARFAKYSSDNSYHPTKSEKAGGAPKMQDGNKGRYTARDTRCNCGPIATYSGSKEDRNG